MIQRFLRDILQIAVPDLTWTESFRSDDDEKGTVYYEGGGKPGEYDVPIRYPSYMVYITSADWEYAEYAAQLAYDALHTLAGHYVDVEFKQSGIVMATKRFKIQMITAQGEPNDLGINPRNRRDFSINFGVTLIESKEEA